MVIVSIYADDVAAMGIGSDVIGDEDELKDLIAKAFADRTGRIIAGGDLVAKLTALRKMALLPKAADLPQIKDADIGFGDINQA